MQLKTFSFLVLFITATATLFAQNSGGFGTGAFTPPPAHAPTTTSSSSSATGMAAPASASDAVSHIIIELGWTEVGIGLVIIALLQFSMSLWIKARLEGSIKHEYDKLLKDYEFGFKRREQAAKIAKFLAEYAYNRKADSKEYIADIWELSIWLPPKLVCDLTEFLAGNDPVLKDPKTLLIKIRKELHGAHDILEAGQIAHWEPPKSS